MDHRRGPLLSGKSVSNLVKAQLLSCLILLGTAFAPAFAATVWRVGPGLPLATPSAAAKAAADGDTVEIVGAVYDGDVAVWRQHNLTLRGVDGRPHLRSAGRAAERKAIWVIRGNDVTVENVEFSGAAVPHRNAAAIRAEGRHLTLDGVVAHDNEMGILASPSPDSDIIIRRSVFHDNYVRAEGRPIGHNVYIGRVRSLRLENSVVYGARIGHNVKSRATETILIGNRIYDGPTGRASYLVDLPNGGMALLRGNRLDKGMQPENIAFISYGAEKKVYPDSALLIENNTFSNAHRRGIFVHNHASIPARLKGNVFKGAGAPLKGSGEIIQP